MFHLTEEKLRFLETKANDIRISIIEMLIPAGSGHTAGPLGMADIFTAFYFHILKHDPNNPEWDGRDRLVLSNGHICPVQYATLAHAGYFPLEELLTLRKLGTRLQGHPHRTALPGLETTSGPLGSGLSQATGMALALKIDHKPNLVYCLMSDGEHDAGNTWEAAMLAGNRKLDNLACIIDRNNIQIDGMTEDIMPLEPLSDKYKSFGWHVIDIDGNNIREFAEAVEESKNIYEKPTLIMAHTVPGKGVKEIEFDFLWHGKPPKPDEAKKFVEELKALEEKIKSEPK